MNFRISIRPAVLLLLAAHVVPALGDDWGQPKVQNVFSPNGAYFVRIVPGERAGQISSKAQFYALRKDDRSYRLIVDVSLQNAIQPTYAKLTDDGYLVTFDEWASVGRKTAIAFYGPQGKLIRAIDISELYSPDELGKIRSSVTRTPWRCRMFLSVDDSGRSTLDVYGNGRSFSLDPKAGSVTRSVTENTCDLSS